jgi:hypothetical protein
VTTDESRDWKNELGARILEAIAVENQAVANLLPLLLMEVTHNQKVVVVLAPQLHQYLPIYHADHDLQRQRHCGAQYSVRVGHVHSISLRLLEARIPRPLYVS